MSEPILAFRDPWIIKMRELEAKRLQKNRKPRRAIVVERMPWPEASKITPDEKPGDGVLDIKYIPPPQEILDYQKRLEDVIKQAMGIPEEALKKCSTE